MAGDKRQVGGHVFHTKQDYEDALHDEKLIQEIRKKVNFNNRKQLQELYASMQSGAVTFRSILGREFDDEVYELIEELKKNSSDQDDRGKGRAGKTPADAKVEEAAKKILNFRERRRRIFMICCGLVAIASLAYFGYYYFLYYRSDDSVSELAQLKEQQNTAIPQQTVTVQNEETNETVVLTVLEEYKTLYNRNRSLIGWIKIDDTNIDYPVMQSQDADYYLTHNFNQEYDNNGSIFLDPGCDIVNRNTNLIIYGHHMRSGRMFGNLDDYSSQSFFEEHRYIQFDTIYEKGTYEVMYVFRSRVYNEDEIVFKYYQFIDVDSEVEFYSNMNEMAEMSLYDTGVTAVYGDRLLTLSTCDYQETNGRFVVVAKKIA